MTQMKYDLCRYVYVLITLLSITVTCCNFALQDSLPALVADLSFPAIRRNKNVENFLNRCKFDSHNKDFDSCLPFCGIFIQSIYVIC